MNNDKNENGNESINTPNESDKNLSPDTSEANSSEAKPSNDSNEAFKDSSEKNNTVEQNKAVKQNISSGPTWLRLFFMLVIIFLYGVTRAVLGAVVVVQFFWVLFTSESNEQLKQLGQQLASYTYQIVRYLTFNTEDRPFPFDLEWPKD